MLALCDQLAADIVDKHSQRGVFRRFAATDCGYDVVLYLDADILVLRSLAPAFDAVESSGHPWVFTDITPNSVYATSSAHEAARALGGGRAWNAGSFFTVSSPGLLEEMTSESRREALVRAGLKLEGCADQSFLNWWLDRSTHHGMLLSELDGSAHTWAGHAMRMQSGTWTLATPGHTLAGMPMPFVHWAGTLAPSFFMPHASMWWRARLRADRRWPDGAALRSLLAGSLRRLPSEARASMRTKVGRRLRAFRRAQA